MATAKTERALYEGGQGILATAEDDEPIFILRGNDQLAWSAILHWISDARVTGVHPKKIWEVEKIAAKFGAWPDRRYPD